MKTSRLLQKLHILHPPKQADVDWDRCLPVEILEKIFGYILKERETYATRIAYTRGTFQPTLRAAALVCWVWYDVATKHLYSDIYLSSTKALEILCDALSKYKRLRPLVHQLYFSKAYATGNAQMLVTAVDIYNFNKIYEICPGLDDLSGPNPLTKPLPPNDELTFRALKLDQPRMDRLTYLEICLLPAAFFGGRMCFSSSVEFPALQQLYISASWHSYSYDIDFATPQWFRMPQLRRLSVCNFKIRFWQKLTFPEHSPLINTIELVRGNYGMLTNLFNPIASPLLPYAKTLESLTITAEELGGSESYYRYNWQAAWSLGFLENLAELCVPFRSFAKTRIVNYPPLLKDLILTGYLPDRYLEPERVVRRGENGIAEIFRSMMANTGPQYLKRIRVSVNDSTNSWTKEILLPEFARSLDVDLQWGAGKPYGLSDLGCEVIDIGMKKLRRAIYSVLTACNAPWFWIRYILSLL